MINLKVSAESTSFSLTKILVVFLALSSLFTCERKIEKASQVSFLENRELLKKFPKSVITVADFLDHWEAGQKVSGITEEPETANGKLQYTIDLQSSFDHEKKTAVFSDFNKELIKKYHYLQFILDISHNKVIVIAETTEMSREKSKK